MGAQSAEPLLECLTWKKFLIWNKGAGQLIKPIRWGRLKEIHDCPWYVPVQWSRGRARGEFQSVDMSTISQSRAMGCREVGGGDGSRVLCVNQVLEVNPGWSVLKPGQRGKEERKGVNIPGLVTKCQSLPASPSPNHQECSHQTRVQDHLKVRDTTPNHPQGRTTECARISAFIQGPRYDSRSKAGGDSLEGVIGHPR